MSRRRDRGSAGVPRSRAPSYPRQGPSDSALVRLVRQPPAREAAPHGGAAGARPRHRPPSSWQRDRSPPARPVADGPICSGAFSRWTRSRASGAGARCGALRASLTGPSSIAFSRSSRRAPPWHARTARAGRRRVARRCNNGRSMLRPPPPPAHPCRRDSVPGASTGAAWRARTLALGPPSVASNAWCTRGAQKHRVRWLGLAHARPTRYAVGLTSTRCAPCVAVRYSRWHDTISYPCRPRATLS